MRCCICGFDMLWRHSGETHDETHGEYLGNACYTYGYRHEIDEGHFHGIDHSRCCDWCDRLYETPARLGKTGQEREMLGRALLIASELSYHNFSKVSAIIRGKEDEEIVAVAEEFDNEDKR